MKNIKQSFLAILLVLCFLVLNVSTIVASAVESDTVYDKSESAYEMLESAGSIDKEQFSPLVLESLDSAECMISKYVSADQFNRASHIERLYAEEELDTYVFLNSDGTKSVYYMDENVKFFDKNGDVREKDISLVSKSDGYGIVRNEFDLHIPNSATSGISMSYNGYEVKITPQSTARTAPARKVGETVVYDGFFGTNTSLVYTPMLSGIKEDVIMKAYIPSAEFSFVLDTDGLGLYNNGEGYYLAESESSEVILELGKVIIYDAIGKPDYGTMNVTTVTANQKYILSLSAPEEFLTDPTTVYPVTIDPTLTVSDTATGDGAIEDTVLFSGRPTKNYGDYKYLSIGYVDSTYGAGRVAVKLPGLYNSVEYQNITASEITSVKFYCRDSSGNSAQNINLYRITSAAWDENTVTYGDSVTYSTATNWGTSLPSGTATAFDITTLVKGWKNGTYTATKGFILINPNETSASYKKAPYSSEYTTTSYRPYVVFTYETDGTLDISNGNKTADIIEGETRQLMASNPYGMGYTWTSSNTAVATVSSTGMVSAHKAGETTITASYIFNGGTYNTTCTVYVCIADAVYYIKNLNSNYYLHVKYGEILNCTDVYQYSKYSQSASNDFKIRQMWKICYLESGRYSIRPLNKLNMGLDVTNGNVDIYNIGTSDKLSDVPSYGEWTISWYSTGYIFKNNGNDSLTMQIKDASTASAATVVASAYSTNVNCRWGLTKVSSPPAGAYLYDLEREAIVDTAIRTINVGATKTLSVLQLNAVAYSGTDIRQNFTWDSDDDAIATVDSNGSVTGVSSGKATITGSVYRNGAHHYVRYTICVGFPSVFNSLINSHILTAGTVDATDDGMFLTTIPLSTILSRNGIYSVPINAEYSKEWDVDDFFDDWYLYAVNDSTSVSYGLYKMREQETDEDDGNDPGVTISFIGFDISKLTNCFNSNTNANKYNLYQAIVKVTGPESHEADDIITSYFADTLSDGAYLIAEKSVLFFANRSSGNKISASDNLVAIFDEIAAIDEELDDILLDNDTRATLIQRRADLQRIPDALEDINSTAGTTIFDFSDYTINVQNKNNLTINERQAILACFTGNVTFNSFVAEVEFHAEAVDDWKSIFDRWYDAAIRADMSVGEEYESGFYDDYYDLNSSIVVAQKNAHGEY